MNQEDKLCSLRRLKPANQTISRNQIGPLPGLKFIGGCTTELLYIRALVVLMVLFSAPNKVQSIFMAVSSQV